jgi:hypothetical protein
VKRLAAVAVVIAACGRAAGGDRTVLELANWAEVREAELENGRSARSS